MADVFISYRRKPSAALAQLIQEKLKNRHHIDAYVDTTRTDSVHVPFPDRLMDAIADTPVFICLLGEGTLESEWVRKEIQRAYELEKHLIPIFQESYVPSVQTDPAIVALLNFDGVHILDIKNIYIDEAIAQIAALVRMPQRSRRLPIALGGVLIVVVAVALVLLYINQHQPLELTPALTIDRTNSPTVAIALLETQTQNAFETMTMVATIATSSWTPTNSPTQSNTPSNTLTATLLPRTPRPSSTIDLTYLPPYTRIISPDDSIDFNGNSGEWKKINEPWYVTSATHVTVKVGFAPISTLSCQAYLHLSTDNGTEIMYSKSLPGEDHVDASVVVNSGNYTFIFGVINDEGKEERPKCDGIAQYFHITIDS